MLLTIDVGNTQTHIGMFRDDELIEHWRFATSRTTTNDELAIRVAALLRLRGLTLDEVDGAIVATPWRSSPSMPARRFATRSPTFEPSPRKALSRRAPSRPRP